ncbi:MAG TPA: metallophosphoesterase [Bacteroidota bacterium]|nr:metallophosphoesterase [Bacteroidota bacterium]
MNPFDRPFAKIPPVAALAFSVLMAGCGIGPYYLRPGEAAAPDSLSGPAPGSTPVYHLAFIGDAGYAGPDNDAPIRAIAVESKNITTPKFTAYLGDNVYYNGMPPLGDPDRDRAESVIDTELVPFFSDTAMRGIFIPGNHDWAGMGEDGRASVVRQSKYIRAATNSRIRLVPDSAGPGPALVVRNDVLQVIALDTQWWLHRYDKPTYPGADSDSATAEIIADSLWMLISEFTGKVTIILGHHPFETHGPHGGFFDWRDHIFPLRNIVAFLWLPLPVIGSAYPLLRTTGYSEQDMSNSRYKNMVLKLGPLLVKGGRIIYASGHEHDLQVIRPTDDLWFLVSGNGILDHASPLSRGRNTLFASETAGYMTLDVYDDGGVMLKVIGVEDKTSGGRVLYQRWIPPLARLR